MYVTGPNISNIFNIWPLLSYLDWRTCGDPSKFLFTPALFLIISKACCAAIAFAVFLLFPVPLHLNKLPTFTSQVNNFMLESPSSSSTGWKKTDSPTWAAISNNKLTEFLYRFWGYDKISFISRSLLSAIFFCRIVDQLEGAKQKIFVRKRALPLINEWLSPRVNALPKMHFPIGYSFFSFSALQASYVLVLSRSSTVALLRFKHAAATEAKGGKRLFHGRYVS